MQCIAGQVIAAQSLDSENDSSGQQERGLDGRFRRVGAIIREAVGNGIAPDQETRLWTALRAGIGLSMKTSIGRIDIFRLTELAELEGAHGCSFTIIG